MPARRLTVPLLGLVLAALAGCGHPAREGATGCTADPDCGDGAYCLDGACHASVAPAATIATPASPTTARLLSFTGSATDPDPGDSITAWSWTVSRGPGGCEAEPQSPSSQTLEVVFWCAGTYEVTLTATDAHGVVSPPRKVQVAVAASSGLPTVTVAADILVGHHCAGAPLTCELDGPVSLSATGQDAQGGPVTYEWTVVPPPLVTAAEVTPPGAQASPLIRISTPGTAIAGTWTFRVRVEDAVGRLAQASQVVEVGNRPPLVDLTPLGLDHRYADGRYRSEGALTAAVTDPDGDPVVWTGSFAEPAGSGCTTAFAAGSGAFSLSCTAAASLIGGVSRALHVEAVDPNGGAASAEVPIEIRNRLPVVRPIVSAAATELALDHGVGACPTVAGSCFQVVGTQPFQASDPDGDPISEVALAAVVAAGHPASVGELLAGSPPGFRFTTPVSKGSEFRGGDGASGFTIRGTASDPFGASPFAELAIRIGNRPPVVKALRSSNTGYHAYVWAAGEYQSYFDLSTFEDPDGDPLGAAGSTGDAACNTFSMVGPQASVLCRLPFAASRQSSTLPPLAALLGTHSVVVWATDGWSGVQAPATVTIENRPPALSSWRGAVESCACVCPKLAPDGTCAGKPTYRLSPTTTYAITMSTADQDGDPLLLTMTPATYLLASRITEVAGWATLDFNNPPLPWTVTVDATDGVEAAPTPATVTITGVVCSLAGQACSEY